MINREATIRWKGYDPTKLAKYSKKRVWAVCDKCDKGRWVQFRAYGELCTVCTQIGKHHGKKATPSPAEHLITPDERMINLPSGGMIDRVVTIRWKGYDPLDLSHGSQRKVWAVCEICGGGRWLRYKSCSARCKACALIGTTVSVETRIKQSKVRRGRTLSEEHRKKVSDGLKGLLTGEKNPMWRGGVSFEPYCPKFNEAFKESIREKFDRVCFLCPTTEEENGRKLCVHHVNYDKSCLCDESDCEFVPLCDSCHSKTNHNREYWENTILDELNC